MKRITFSIFCIASVILAVLACAGTVGAVSITAEEWNNLSTSDQINGNASYEFTGTGIINPKFTGSASSKYVPNRSITFDFTEFQGTFAGVPASTKSYQGALFGNVRNTTGAFAITINNLTLTDVAVTSTTGSHIGGIIGYLQGATKGDVTLNLTNCTLINCTITSTKSSPVGGLVGNLKFQAKGNVTLNIIGCRLIDTAITGAGGETGGLFGIFTYPGSSFGPFSSDADSAEFPPRPPVSTTSGKVNLDTCSAQHCSINGQGGVGSLIGYCTGGGYAVAVTDCAVDACVLSGTSRTGGIVGDSGGGSVSFARCMVENTSLVLTNQNSGAKLGGLLGGNDESVVKGITNCTVKNCLLISPTKLPNMKGYGGLVGGAKSVAGIINSMVMNCTVVGSSQVGGLIGGVLSEPSGCSGNLLKNSAVKGNMTTQLDCGNYSGSVGCTVFGSYLNTNDTMLVEPQVFAFTYSDNLSVSIPAVATVVTQMTDIGVAANQQSAVGYIIDKTALLFHPCNGSRISESGIVSLGDTTLAFDEPVYMGYTFAGWNLTSSSGTMITDANGTLQANVAGYTNASGLWNNASGTAVDIYANWTGNPYYVSFSANGGTGEMPLQDFIYGAAPQNLCSNTFVRTGYSFAGWSTSQNGPVIYTDNQSVQNLVYGGTVVLYAVWTNTVSVVNVHLDAVNGSTPFTVKLMSGNAVVRENLSVPGDQCAFTAIPQGTYAIVTEDSGVFKKKVTSAVTVDTRVVDIFLTFPVNNVSSEVVVSSEGNTPGVVVGGLDKEAADTGEESKNVTMTMTVEAKKESASDMNATIAISAIKDNITNPSIVREDMQFLDINLDRTVDTETTSVHTTTNLIEIVVPYDFTGKDGIIVSRYHENVYQPLTEIFSDAGKAEGTYRIDRTKGKIHLYVQKFSIYSIGYTIESPNPQPSSSGSSRQSGSTIILPETAVPTVTPTVVSTAMPTVIQTVKPTTLPTQSSPVPIVVLIAGLGVAIFIRAKMRP